MPVGFCCSRCLLYDEKHTCLVTKNRPGEEDEAVPTITPISAFVDKEGLIKIVLKDGIRKIPIIIDLSKVPINDKIKKIEML